MQRNGMAGTAPAPAPPESSDASAESPRAATTRSEAPASSPASTDSQPARTGNDWFREAFNAQRYGLARTRQPEAPGTGQSASESDESASTPQPRESRGPSQPAPSTPSERAPQPGPPPGALVLSEQELERRVQSETDRRLDKFQREESERRKRDERRRLRETDPYAYAALEKEEEAKSEALQRELAQAHRMTLSTVETYDKTVLDPLMRAVPADRRAAILESIAPGLPGRGQAAEQALKTLQEVWKQAGVEEARRALMNDQGFIKEVLARHAGVRQEPDTIPAVSGPAGRPANINDRLRGAARSIRSRS